MGNPFSTEERFRMISFLFFQCRKLNLFLRVEYKHACHVFCSTHMTAGISNDANLFSQAKKRLPHTF